jgi:hypothetical protein
VLSDVHLPTAVDAVCDRCSDAGHNCNITLAKSPTSSTARRINPLLVQYKSLLPGQEGCIFFSGHLNVHKYHHAVVRLGRQAAFKSTTL